MLNSINSSNYKTIEGKGGIKATVIADSISEAGVRITTMELEYHRYINSEFMTHRLFSRNAASSRAIPVAKMLELVGKAPATPIHWGKNQSGMQAKEECHNLVDLGAAGVEFTPEDTWKFAAKASSNYAEALADAGYHKQIVNRLLEPFQMMKVVVTATEWDNFFWLRDDEAAQPEIQELARCMKKAMDGSEPVLLKAGQWHLPYADGIEDLDTALKFSVARCAAVSYRNDAMTIEKAEKIWDMLLSGGKVHASPFEHQATPVKNLLQNGIDLWERGVTHLDHNYMLWSGNFKGFVQHRQLIPNHVYNGGK
jgi:thymidylate synthase ThyX